MKLPQLASKNHSLKTSILFVVSLFILIAATHNQANANMFNRFKKGFYFEKYSNPEEAKEALLKLHPIGSDVVALVRTLEMAGGRCYEIENVIRNKKPTTVKRCEYKEKEIFLDTKWRVIADYNINLITDLFVGSGIK
jgi:hypothetical protein